ncbi:MAG: hypothetical protein PUH87_03575 [Bacteroidales bacterium]|nr:hypothetical protein [Bacteroidales bacterium]MDY3742095.1 hypothetical protein [Prevotella sp.]MDY5449447.1 hypothetical protein [Prevotella sp.]
MKDYRTLALSAALALAFAITTPANAQFGNILNKAKKAVKEKVEKSVTDTKKKAQSTATDAVDNTTGKAATSMGVSEMSNGNHDASEPATEMAKGVSVPANVKSKADAEARKQWGAGFVKSIFLTSQWTEFTNPKYPYQVMHRSMDVDFIVKEGDNYFVYHWVFKEGVYGGKGTGAFSIMARMKRPTKEKVNYK